MDVINTRSFNIIIMETNYISKHLRTPFIVVLNFIIIAFLSFQSSYRKPADSGRICTAVQSSAQPP